MNKTVDKRLEKLFKSLSNKTIENVTMTKDNEINILFKEFGSPILSLKANTPSGPENEVSLSVKYIFPSNGEIFIGG
jgi:hypothetical protein